MIKSVIFDFANVIFFGNQPQWEQESQFKKVDDLNVFINCGFINQSLLDFVKQNLSNYQKVVLSNSVTLVNHPKIRPVLEETFDHIFTSKDVGLVKDKPEVYEYLATEMQVATTNILFIDDTTWNIEAAQAVGCQTILFENNQQVFTKITKLINDRSSL